MTISHKSFFVLCLVALSSAAGCSSGRDVEVSGTATAANGQSTKGTVRVEVYDLVDAANPKLAGATKLDASGKFSDKFSIEGDSIKIVAIDDADANEACSLGELWGTTTAKVAEDAASGIAIVLDATPCAK